MKRFLYIFLFLSFSVFSQNLIIVGQIPGKYLKTTQLSRLGYIEVEGRIIKKIAQIKKKATILKLKKRKNVLFLTSSSKPTLRSKFDYIFPGLIDLHNHTKQNNIGVWPLAQGQFQNRFEWRKWKAYKYSVSGNMNPWISYGKPNECAVFRWSELQAMVMGTTYLQGPSSCIKQFSINQIEDKKSFISNKDRVSAPTDLIFPNEMVFIWNELRPMIIKGASYEEALAKTINKYCDIQGITAENINSSINLKKLKNQNLLKAKCIKKKLPPKFIRYIYWIHPTIVSKKRYLKRKTKSAVIAHLAEGRRDDYYNQKEFELIKLLGLDLPGLNFVHGVGLSNNDFAHMGKRKMGLIWSPFSNLILYGQTLDIFNAKKNRVLLALGSDWLPTGTRGVLDELKIAAKYIDKDPEKQNLKKYFSDLELYKMVTENPAKLINHYENSPSNGEHGIGQISVGAMASFTITSNLDKNPYTSLVRKTYERNIKLVIVDGQPIYGNINYIQKLGFNDNNFEILNHHLDKITDYNLSRIDYVKSSASKESKYKHLLSLATLSSKLKYKIVDHCNFKIPKVLVHQNSLSANKHVEKFLKETGLNLDRFLDMRKLIALNMLSQTRNLRDQTKGNKKYKLSTFVSLYSCDDPGYKKRVSSFLTPGSNRDEYSRNKKPSFRKALRIKYKLGRVPASLKEKYKE